MAPSKYLFRCTVRTGLVLLLASVLFTPPVRAADVAILLSGDMSAYSACLQSCKDALPGSEVFETTVTESDHHPALLASLTKQNPRVVLGIGAKATKLAQNLENAPPLVYAMVFNPYELGMVAPNAAGVAMISSPESQLKTIQELIPHLKSVGVIYDAEKSMRFIEEGRRSARELRVAWVEEIVTSSQEISQSLKKIIPKIDCLWLLPDTTVVSRDTFQYIIHLTLERSVPVFSFSEGFVKAGAFAALAPDYESIGKESARLISRVLQGELHSGASLTYPGGSLYLNLHTAEALKMNIPESIRRRAKQLY